MPLTNIEKEKIYEEEKERDAIVRKLKQKGDAKALGQGCLVIIAIIVTGVIFLGGDSDKTTDIKESYKTGYENGKTMGKESTEEDDMSTVALIMSRDYMKEVLVSPSTAKFAGVFDAQDYGKMNEDTYFVVSYVDSQNSFGAMLRSDYNMWLRYKGGDKYEISNWEVTRWVVNGEDILNK